jgi:predicted RNase H-like HicB family nuclease
VRYRILIEQDEDGMFVAECPSLPGCISQGKTREEALINIEEAIKGYIQSLKKHNEPIPPPIEEEIVNENPPHRRLTVPDHDEIAKGTLRSILRQAGLAVEELKALMEG